jgi:hypothetical protein
MLSLLLAMPMLILLHPQKEAPKKESSRKVDSVYMLGNTPKPPKPAEEPSIVTLPSNLGNLTIGSTMPTSKKHKPKAYTVLSTEEMPEGADAASDEEDKKKKKRPQKGAKATEEDALGEINLSAPLGVHETLPVQRHRTEVLQEQSSVTVRDYFLLLN